MGLSVADVSVGFTSRLDGLFKGLDAVAKRLEKLSSQDVVIRLEVDSKTERNITRIADRLDYIVNAVEGVIDGGKRLAANFGLSMTQVEQSVAKTTTKVQGDFEQLEGGVFSRFGKFGAVLDRFFSPRLTTTIFGAASGLSLLIANGFSLQRIVEGLSGSTTSGLDKLRSQVTSLQAVVSVTGFLGFLKTGAGLLGDLLPKLFGTVTIIGLLLRGVNALAGSIEGLLRRNPGTFLGQAANLLTNINKGLFTLEFRLRRNLEKFRLIPGVFALVAAIFAKVNLGLTGLFAAGPIAVAGLQVAIRLVRILGINIQARIFRFRARLGDGAAQFRLFLFSLRQLGPLLTGIGRLAEPLGKALETVAKLKPDKIFGALRATVVALLSSFDALVANVQRMVDILDKRLPGATQKLRRLREEKDKLVSTRGKDAGPRAPPGENLVKSLGLSGRGVLETLTTSFNATLTAVQRVFRSRLAAFTPGFKKALSSFLLGVLVLKPTEVTLPLVSSLLGAIKLALVGVGSLLGAGGGGGGGGFGAFSVATGILSGLATVLGSPLVWKPLLVISVGAAVKAAVPFLKELPKKFGEGVQAGLKPLGVLIRGLIGPFVSGIVSASSRLFGGGSGLIGSISSGVVKGVQVALGRAQGRVGKVVGGFINTTLGIAQGILGGGLQAFGAKKLGDLFFKAARKSFGRSNITAFLRNTFKIAGAIIPGLVGDIVRNISGVFAASLDLIQRPFTGAFKGLARKFFAGGPLATTRAAIGAATVNQGLEPSEGGTTEEENRTKRQQRIAQILDDTADFQTKTLGIAIELAAKQQQAIRDEIRARQATIEALLDSVKALEGSNNPASNKKRQTLLGQLVEEESRLRASVAKSRELLDLVAVEANRVLGGMRGLAGSSPELTTRIEAAENLMQAFLGEFQTLSQGTELKKLGIALRLLQSVAQKAGRKTSPLQALGQQGVNLGSILSGAADRLESIQDVAFAAIPPNVDAFTKGMRELLAEFGLVEGDLDELRNPLDFVRKRLEALASVEGDLVAKSKRLATSRARAGVENADPDDLLAAYDKLDGAVSRAAKSTDKVDVETRSLLEGLGTLAEATVEAATSSKKRAKAERKLAGAASREAAIIERRINNRSSSDDENRARTGLNLFARLGRAITTGVNTNNESLDPAVLLNLLTSGLKNRGDSRAGQTLRGGGKGFAQGTLGKAFIKELEDIFATAESADGAVRRLLLFIDNQGPKSAEALELVAATGKSIQEFASSKTGAKDLKAFFEPLGGAAPRVAGILTSFQALTQLLGTNKNVLGTILKPNAQTKNQLKAANIGLDDLSNIVTAEITEGIRNKAPFEQLVTNIQSAIRRVTAGTNITESGLGINKAELEKSLKGKFEGTLKITDFFEGGTLSGRGTATFTKLIERLARASFKSFRKAGGTIGDELIKGVGALNSKIVAFFEATLGYHSKHESPPRGIVGTIERSFGLAGLTIGQQLLRGVGALRDATQNFFREGFGAVVTLVQASLVLPVQKGTELIEKSIFGLGNTISSIGNFVGKRSPLLLKFTGLPFIFNFITAIAGSVIRLGGAVVSVFGRTFVAAVNAAAESVKVLLSLIRDVAKEVRDFGFQAQRAGVPVGQFDQLSKALKRFDVDVTEVSQTLIILQQSVGEALRDPLGETAKNFQLAGIAIAELKELDPVSLLFRIGEAAERAADSPEELRRTLELAGASLTNLRAALTDRDSLAEEFRKAAESDLISEEELARAKGVVNAVQDVQRFVDEIKRALVRGFGSLTFRLIDLFRSGVLDRKPRILAYVEAAAETVSRIVLRIISFGRESLNLGRFRTDLSAIFRYLIAQGQILVSKLGLFLLREARDFLPKMKDLLSALKEDFVADIPRQFLRAIITISQGVISVVVRLLVAAVAKSINFIVDQFPDFSEFVGLDRLRVDEGDLKRAEDRINDFTKDIAEVADELEKFLGLNSKDPNSTRNLELLLKRLQTQAEKNKRRIEQLNPELFKLINAIQEIAGTLPAAAQQRLDGLTEAIARAKKQSDSQTYKKMLEELAAVARQAEESRRALETFEQKTEPFSQFFSAAGSLGEFFNQIDIQAERTGLQIDAAADRLRVIALEYPDIIEKARTWFSISQDEEDVLGTIEEKIRGIAAASVELQRLEQVQTIVDQIADTFQQTDQSDLFPALRSVMGDALRDATRLERQLNFGLVKLQSQLKLFAEFNKRQFLAVARQLESDGVVKFSVGIEEGNIETLFSEITEQISAAIDTQVRNKILQPLVEQVRTTIASNLVDSTLDLFRGLADGSILEAARTAEESAREAGVKFSKVLFILGELGKSIFSKALDSFIDQIRTRITDALTKTIVDGIVNGQTLGAVKKISEEMRRSIGLAASGLLAVLGLVLSRLQSTAEATADSIESAVEASEAVRGVISGDTTVAIKEVGEKLSEALRGTENRLDVLIALTRAGLQGDAVPSVPVSPLSTVAATTLAT